MTDEEIKDTIDNMSEDELNEYVFFALKEMTKKCEEQQTEIEKKDKIIDEMAEWINRIDSTIFCNKSKCNDNCKECVIKEFTKKVEIKDE